MRIGELARRAGVNVETLRYYERRGLLEEPPRGPAGHRTYDEEAVRFVRAIKEAQGLGFSLAEIEEYLRAARRGGDGGASQTMRVRLAAKIDEVDAKVAALRRVRDELARVVGCACDSLDRCTCGAAYLARGGRDPQPATAGPLHVTNGDSAGNTLRRTGLGGAVLPWQDVLHEGPVPAVPPERLRELRARFLADCGWGDARSIRDDMERRDRLLVDALREDRDVVLWFEYDLYDQLQLLQALALTEDESRARLALIDADVFLGSLEADELEALWPSRVAVDDGLVALAVEAWDAVRAAEPARVAELAARGTPALPHLAPALVRLLEELPGADDGLSRTERQLVQELAAAGPATPVELFVREQTREESPFLGDAWFFRTLSELGRGERRLVETTAGDELPAPPPLTDPRAYSALIVALTDNGRAVLEGEADRVDLLGIDRWLGGIHLRDGNVWRWNRETSGVVGP